MRSILLVICIFSISAFSFSQEKLDAYQIENSGYFTHPSITKQGLVFTDNAASKIYLLQNKEILVIANTPGCGRYYTVSPDKTKIGFKKINPDGMQVPAVIDLQTLKVTELSDAVDLCGQVSFSNDGKMAYTIGSNLYVVDKNENVKTYFLGIYSNIVPVSTDGNSAVYNNDSDQLFVIDLATGQTKQITDNSQGYMLPQWSPDGSKILFSTLSGTLMVYNKITDVTYIIGTGENGSWSDDSQKIIYDVIASDDFEFNGSDLYMTKYDGSSVARLTNTSGTNEMFPSFADNGTVVFSTYERREIIAAEYNQDFSGILSADTLVKSLQPVGMTNNQSDQFTQKLLKADTKISGDAPYLHQMYDTPDWHHGSGSCAPTTAAMALAYYNRLPYWDITVSSPSSHISHYGSYVADMYRYGEVYYNTVSQTSGGEDAWGGYGYMWGLGSPNSYMATYIQNHDVTSVHSTTTTFAEVQAEVDQSYPFPICSLLSTAGHLTLTVGYVNGQHTLIFNDPYGDKNDGSWPNYNGKDSYYDWPGYNNGYQNLNTMAWTVTSESSEAVYNDTIIDDVYYNHGFYINNQGVALMRYYRDSKTGGYNGHYWWTYTSSSTTTDTCYVSWTPTIPTAGDYEVFAYIPTANASATSARYKIYYNGGNQTVIVNQAPIYGDWVSLGTFPFLAGTSGYVRLGDAAGVQSQKIAFDAMKWVNVTQPAAVASFTASATVCEGNSVQYTNTSTNATSYSWTFEGGSPATSTQTNPLIMYSNPGTYDVILVATGPGGSDTLSMTNYIAVNSPATAAFSVSDTLVYLPSANVTFTNASGSATAYNWDFGDGNTSTQQNPSHAYISTGYYTVMLVAINSQCGNDTAYALVHVQNPLPVAGFNADQTTVCEGTNVQFTSSSSNATNYSWAFAGGTPSSSTQQNPSVLYSNAGTYSVQLVATGSGGSDTLLMQNYITVDPAALAQFSTNDTLVFLPSAFVTFTNTSSNATSYLWDFGDGTASTDQNPWHNYVSAGYYTIILIAYNSQCGNDTLIMTGYIHVDVASSVTEMNPGDEEIVVRPNPSDGDFVIIYELKDQETVEVKLYDVLGNEISVLGKTLQQQGKHEIFVRGGQMNLSKGIYLLKICMGNEVFRKKIIYQK